jgi:hypothetical protein
MRYPEQIPSQADSMITNFNFSFSAAEDAFRNVKEQHSQLDQRISSIVDSEKFFVNGFPVLKNILVLSPKKNDLKKLAKALDRLADIIDLYDATQAKLTLIETLQKDPHWFTGTFGDFSKEVSDDLDLLS